MRQTTHKIDEKKLIEKAQNSKAGFADLYHLYHNKIFLFILKRVEDEASAKDITSNTFVKAFLNIKKFTYKGYSISSWLFRIAINEMNTFFKQKSKQRVISIEQTGLSRIIEDIQDHDQSYFKCEENSLVMALDQLNDTELMLIELRFFEKLSFKEIGDIVGCTENNAKVKGYRILKKLKKILDEQA